MREQELQIGLEVGPVTHWGLKQWKTARARWQEEYKGSGGVRTKATNWRQTGQRVACWEIMVLRQSWCGTLFGAWSVTRASTFWRQMRHCWRLKWAKWRIKGGGTLVPHRGSEEAFTFVNYLFYVVSVVHLNTMIHYLGRYLGWCSLCGVDWRYRTWSEGGQNQRTCCTDGSGLCGDVRV